RRRGRRLYMPEARRHRARGGTHLGGERPEPRADPGRGPADRAGAHDTRVTVEDRSGDPGCTWHQLVDRQRDAGPADLVERGPKRGQARDGPLRVPGERQRAQDLLALLPGQKREDGLSARGRVERPAISYAARVADDVVAVQLVEVDDGVTVAREHPEEHGL